MNGKTKMSVNTAGIIITLILLLPAATVGIFYLGCFVRLYTEIGATPWSVPEVNVTLAESDIYTADDLRSAADTALEAYKDEWYQYNGFYLLELEYTGSDRIITEDGQEILYFKAVTFAGIDTGWDPERAYDRTGHWTVEKKDGKWVSRGWGHA